MEREECKSPDSYTFVTMVEKVVADRDRKLEIYFGNGIKHSNLTSTEQWPFFAVVRELPGYMGASCFCLTCFIFCEAC